MCVSKQSLSDSACIQRLDGCGVGVRVWVCGCVGVWVCGCENVCLGNLSDSVCIQRWDGCVRVCVGLWRGNLSNGECVVRQMVG